MADMNERVLNMVVDAMRTTAKPDAKVLLAKAQEMDPSLRGMSVFAFSGKYMGTARNRLQGRKRARKAVGGPSAKKASAKKAPAKQAVAKKQTVRKVAAKTSTPMAAQQSAPVAKKAPTKKAGRKAGTRKLAAQPTAARSGGVNAAPHKFDARARRQIRNIFMSFAKDVSKAKGNDEKMIEVVAGVEGHLDKIEQVFV